MTHREVLEALSGLLLGMFVAILVGDRRHRRRCPRSSATSAAASPPTPGSSRRRCWPPRSPPRSGASWPTCSAASCSCSSALVIFVAGSALAGLVAATACSSAAAASRASASAVSPRSSRSSWPTIDRARASAAGTPATSAPTFAARDGRRPAARRCASSTPRLGLALVLLRRRARSPSPPSSCCRGRCTCPSSSRAQGAASTTSARCSSSAGSAILLIWVSLAGHQFDWASWQTAAMVGGGAAACSSLAVLASSRGRTRAAHPAAAVPRPHHHAGHRRQPRSSASRMFGGTVFLSQYIQLARGKTPDRGRPDDDPDDRRPGARRASWSAASSRAPGGTSAGWSRGGAAHRRASDCWGPSTRHTSCGWSALDGVLGLGVGTPCRTSCSPCRTRVAQSELGSSSSTVAFFRSLGGAIGVSALGALLGHQVTTVVARGLAMLGVDAVGRGDVRRASRTSPASPRRCGPLSRTRTARRSGTFPSPRRSGCSRCSRSWR